MAVARTSCAEHDVWARGVGGRLAAGGRLGPARGAARPEARCAARRRHGEDRRVYGHRQRRQARLAQQGREGARLHRRDPELLLRRAPGAERRGL